MTTKLRSKIIVTLAVLVLTIPISNLALAQNTLRSNFLKANLVNNASTDMSLDYSSFKYKFFTGLHLAGYRTYNRSENDMLLDFRTDNGLNIKNTKITNLDVLTLDSLVLDSEYESNLANSFYRNIFSALTVEKKIASLGDHYESKLYSVLSILPSNHVSFLKYVKIHDSKVGTNGYGGYGQVILRGGYLIDDRKFQNVFLHELGHVVFDGYKAKFGNEYLAPYLSLYNQSKERSSFVSTYAMTNADEDFSETYDMYVNSAKNFRCLKTKSKILNAKYEFFKKRVFNEIEFNSGNDSCQNITIYDVTDL